MSSEAPSGGTDAGVGSGQVMAHARAADPDVVERYVRGRLPSAERLAFEEHFFRCDECFQQLQLTERFIAGVRQASHAGAWPAPIARARDRWRLWLRPDVLSATAASLVVLVGWSTFTKIQTLRGAVEHERQLRERAELQSRQGAESLQAERQERQRLERLVGESAHNVGDALPPVQANIPVVPLLSARGVEPANELRLRPGDRRFVLWIDVESLGATACRLDISRQDGRRVLSVSGLRSNGKGAVTIELDARNLADGEYILRLYDENGRGDLRQEHRLSVRR